MIEFCDPKSTGHKLIVLLLICLLGFGNYFCYDSPTAIEVPIEEAMSIDTGEFTALYAWYSWPNCIMCVFGGFLIDKYLGIRLGAVVFLILLLVGQLTLSLGAFLNHFWIMKLGRFVYGLGGESLSVAQNTYVVSWFQGNLLNTVFGTQITVSRAGSALSMVTMAPINNITSKYNPPRDALGYTFMIAALTCVISLVCSLILAVLDKRAERLLDRQSIQLEDRDISINDVKTFKSNYWLLTIICVTFYSTIFPFITVGVKYFETKWNYSVGDATWYNSYVYMIAAFLSPFIGLFVDKVGRNLYFLLAACIMLTISHGLMALTNTGVPLPMILFGIGYAIMCSALWPLVALIIPKHQLGTAYGIMQAIQNLGLGIANEISGMLVDWKGYMCLEVFFLFWAGTSIVVTVLLIVQDSDHKGCLNLSAKDRESQQPVPANEPLLADDNEE